MTDGAKILIAVILSLLTMHFVRIYVTENKPQAEGTIVMTEELNEEIISEKIDMTKYTAEELDKKLRVTTARQYSRLREESRQADISDADKAIGKKLIAYFDKLKSDGLTTQERKVWYFLFMNRHTLTPEQVPEG